MAEPDHILFLLTRLQERSYRYLSRELEQRGIVGIEPSHGAIIRQLATHGSLSMTDLARLIDRTKPTVTVLVRKLEKNGYIERVQDPKDGRVTLICLTGKTKALADGLQEVSHRLLNKIFKGFSSVDKRDMVNQLEKAIQNF